MKNYLPIGSVVRLRNGIKTIMIYGRKQVRTEDKKEFDYIACLYPEGNLNANYMYLFNHEDIEEVVFEGYKSEEDQEFVKKLNEIK